MLKSDLLSWMVARGFKKEWGTDEGEVIII
jgi:hypothetical protein